MEYKIENSKIVNSPLYYFRMKKKYYSWDECLSLREVKVCILLIFQLKTQ